MHLRILFYVQHVSLIGWTFCEIQSGAVQPKTHPYLTQRRLYKGIVGIEAAKNVTHKSCFFHQNVVQGLLIPVSFIVTG